METSTTEQNTPTKNGLRGKVSAPGKVIVTGEHSVVYGHPALVAAIDKRTTAQFEAVELLDEDDTKITVKSKIKEEFESIFEYTYDKNKQTEENTDTQKEAKLVDYIIKDI